MYVSVCAYLEKHVKRAYVPMQWFRMLIMHKPQQTHKIFLHLYQSLYLLYKMVVLEFLNLGAETSENIRSQQTFLSGL